MNASPDRIVVIRTRLPYIDRRSLSQAWYSSLHLAAEEAATARPVPPRRAVQDPPTAQQPDRSCAQGAALRLPAPTAPHAEDARRAAAEPPERCRRKATPRAQPVVARSVRGHSAAFTATLSRARVRIAMRHEGNRLQIVAVCSERHAETVRRALALAAVALQLRGTRVHSTVRVEGAE